MAIVDGGSRTLDNIHSDLVKRIVGATLYLDLCRFGGLLRAADVVIPSEIPIRIRVKAVMFPPLREANRAARTWPMSAKLPV